jgi:hypothetical protein
MIIRNSPNVNFTILRNEVLERTDMTLKAKGLYAFLMSKPDYWQISIAGLTVQLAEGREAIMQALRELEKHGYYKKVRTRNENGTFSYEDYLYDEPQAGSPQAGNPSTVKPKADNQAQVNTIKVNTKQERTVEALSKIEPQAVLIAERMAVCIIDNYDFMAHKLSEKDYQRWAGDIEKLHRIDGYDYKVITAVLDWSQKDDFWKQNIRSGATLRKQFTSLLVRIKSQPKQVQVIS